MLNKKDHGFNMKKIVSDQRRNKIGVRNNKISVSGIKNALYK